MNELRRMAYLDALQIDCYVSRTQLPGAALTRRLAIVRTPVEEAGATDTLGALTAPGGALPARQPAGFTRPDFGLDQRPKSAVVEPRREVSRDGEPVPRFSLSAIVAGQWLWLEELDGSALATAQVQLVQAMAQALLRSRGAGTDNTGPVSATSAARPDIAQFDWPLHSNRQLDQGEGAARASVAAFVGRRLEQCGCRGLVLLGQACSRRVSLSQVAVPAVSVASSAEILADPALKRKVWRDLQPLLQAS